eukprot:TRINITY_DN4447_c0_g1_i4.p1 TRINITY_DN4447_c0_g1~~TRINITY_DN4447_c0_g1_i4.p1  ORF type:complete len:360 (+),score=82.99 TRINITY_DN4447_c0_g1_i4:385-1464(+)
MVTQGSPITGVERRKLKFPGLSTKGSPNLTGSSSKTENEVTEKRLSSRNKPAEARRHQSKSRATEELRLTGTQVEKLEEPHEEMKEQEKEKEKDKERHASRPKKLNPKQQMMNEYRHIIFSGGITRKRFEDHLRNIIRGLLYVKNSLQPPPQDIIESKFIKITPEQPPFNKTLALDLDETLVYVDKSFLAAGSNGNSRFIRLPANSVEDFKKICKVRPFAREFLEEVGQFYEVLVFTASSRDYAELVVEILDPERKFIKNILSRENCLETRLGMIIKDLRIIQNRSVDKTIIVDNLAHCFGFQIPNGIPILEWHGEKGDTELKFLADYLKDLANHDNFVKKNDEFFKLESLIARFSGFA